MARKIIMGTVSLACAILFFAKSVAFPMLECTAGMVILVSAYGMILKKYGV